MFFGAAKITFKYEPSASNELKGAKVLCEKLRSRLKVCAKPCATSDNDIPAIAICALASTEPEMDQLLDKVLEICDGSGLGRIDSEFSVVEHIDMLEEDDEDV